MEATIINRELNQKFQPHLEIKVNKKVFSASNQISANATKHWAAGRISAANEDLLTQNLKNKIEWQ